MYTHKKEENFREITYGYFFRPPQFLYIFYDEDVIKTVMVRMSTKIKQALFLELTSTNSFTLQNSTWK
jgi:hypothetical protein